MYISAPVQGTVKLVLCSILKTNQFQANWDTYPSCKKNEGVIISEYVTQGFIKIIGTPKLFELSQTDSNAHFKHTAQYWS